jgi:hypothetical protein
MDFSVFRKGQNYTQERAPHRGTRTVVRLVVAAGLAVRVGQNAIQLTTEAPWKEVEFCARASGVPKL